MLASRDDFQRYRQAEYTLTGLRKDEQQRNKLREQQAKLHTTRIQIETKQRGLHERLHEVALARQQVEELIPFVEQQIALEKRRDDLKDKLTRYNAVMEEGKRLRARTDQHRQKQVATQNRILAIKPLQPTADRFDELRELLYQLQTQNNERHSKQQLLQTKREELVGRQRDRDTVAKKLRQAEASIEQIEAHRQEAEEMPVLSSQRMELTARQNRLEGNIEGYVKSRAQSAGGQCPLLHETCLNIKGLGLVSLESYFDGLLTQEHAELALVQQQQQRVTQREQEIKKYVKELDSVGLYSERRINYADQLEILANQITRLERDIESLMEDLNALKELDAKMSETKRLHDESKDAAAQVRALPGLYEQVRRISDANSSR